MHMIDLLNLHQLLFLICFNAIYCEIHCTDEAPLSMYTTGTGAIDLEESFNCID